MGALPLLTEKQKEVYKFDRDNIPRITICEGAVRSGKTHIDNFVWIKHVARFRNMGVKFIMTGSTIPSLKRNVLGDLDAIFGIDTSLNKSNEFQMFGNTVACFGADRVDSYKPMKGFTAYGWYGNEVTEHHVNTIDQAFKRCSGPGARIFWDTNPSHPKHHIKKQYIDRDGERLTNGRIHIKSWHFVLDDNMFLTEEYKESLKRSTPTGMWYDRDILGLWVSAEGMIYKDFNYEVHVIDKEPGLLHDFFCGVDWGYNHYGVIGVYGKGSDGSIFRIMEYAAQEKTIDYWIDIAKEIKKTHGNIPFYCDPARPDYINEFGKAGISAIAAINDVVPGITYCAGLLKKQQFFVVRSKSKLWLDQIYTYRWREGLGAEAPIKENDDAMDESRYALYTDHKYSTTSTAGVTASELGL